MSLPSVAIAADDLTGAADAAAPFAARGWQASVALDVGAVSPPRPGTVLALDTCSRRVPLALDEADAVARHLASADVAFLKVDSLLRGDVVRDVHAVRSRGRWRRVVLAPAFPQVGRSVLGATVVDRGSERARIDLEALAAAHVGLDAVRSGRLPASGTLAVDAEEPADLAAVAADASPGTLWVGSAGLATALATHLGGEPSAPRPSTCERVLVVVGSRTAQARAQLAALAADGVAATELDALRPAGLAAALAADGVALVAPRPAGFPHEVLVEELARALACCDGLLDGLVVTGGDTARTVLGALGVLALDVVGELEPGIVLCGDGAGRTIVTKSGSFGDDGVLGRLVDQLRGARV